MMPKLVVLARTRGANILARTLGSVRQFISTWARRAIAESERFVYPGVALSAVGHVSLLLAALFFVEPKGLRSPPPESIAVDIVPADEAPPPEKQHLEGTPLESTSRGSEVSSDSSTGSASTAPPRPKADAVPSFRQAQAPSTPPQRGGPADAQPQAVSPPGEGEAPPSPSDAILPPAPAVTPRPNEARRQANAGEMFAMPLALPGGRLGGGFDAPASNPAMLPHDDTAAFRARLSACSRTATMFAMDNNVAIELRIFFKRDGSLAAPPALLRYTSLSADAVALTKMAIDALQRCQPFTELPADKYNDWKTLDLVVTPLSAAGE
jgi:hypothetical protein